MNSFMELVEVASTHLQLIAVLEESRLEGRAASLEFMVEAIDLLVLKFAEVFIGCLFCLICYDDHGLSAFVVDIWVYLHISIEQIPLLKQCLDFFDMPLGDGHSVEYRHNEPFNEQ